MPEIRLRRSRPPRHFAHPSPLMARLLLLVRCALGFIVASGVAEVRAAEKLVPAEFNQVTDSREFRWNINPQGTVTSGVSEDGDRGCLVAAGVLTVNGSGISFPQAQMTSEGREYVFSTTSGPLKLTRRIRLDDREGVMRILDVFENAGDENQELKVTLSATVATGVRQFLTPEKVFNASAPAENQDSILAMPLSGGPSVVLLLADPKGKTKPQLARKLANQITATYNLALKPGESAAIVHYVAQRNVTNSTDGAATIKPMFARLLRDGKLLDPAIPAALRGSIVNFSMGEKSGVAETSHASALTELRSALDGTGLNRGKKDGVALDALGKLTGTVTGGDFGVETEFGKAQIAFADVAGITGGAGVQRPVRVFLRNGEVLAGAVSGAKFAMKSDTGLTFDIDLAQIHMLALREGQDDGKPPAGAVAFLTTHRGDCLALAADAEATLPLASPWGMNRVPLSEIDSLTPVREPFPANRLVLENLSRMLVMLAADETSLTSTRFGKVKLVPQTIRELLSVRNLQPAMQAETKPLGSSTELPPPDAPNGELLGDYRITGLLDLPTLHLASAKGTTEVAVKRIVKLVRVSTERADGEVKVTLADGEELTGKLAESVLPLRSGKCVWQVPLAHFIAVNIPLPEKPKEPAKAAAAKPEESKP